MERHERAREREERHREREEREQERQREREERERWSRKWVDERPRGRQGKEKKRENGGGSLVERALEDMLDNKSFKVGGSKLGASFLGEATSLVVKKVIVETVTKTKATKLHCAMKVSEVLKWLRLVNQLCEGDMETYRTLVFLQAAGEKAFLVREELQAQPQNKEPLNAVLKGVFGVKWQKALRKEWRDMAGRTDGRELWAEVQMVGSTLGETLEQQKRKFFKVLPEEVQAQLMSRYLGEEAVLKLDWEDKMLLEVAFLWKSGKPTLLVPEQPPLGPPRPAAGQPPAHFHQQMSFQPPVNFHPFGQFYPLLWAEAEQSYNLTALSWEGLWERLERVEESYGLEVRRAMAKFDKGKGGRGNGGTCPLPPEAESEGGRGRGGGEGQGGEAGARELATLHQLQVPIHQTTVSSVGCRATLRTSVLMQRQRSIRKRTVRCNKSAIFALPRGM